MRKRHIAQTLWLGAIVALAGCATTAARSLERDTAGALVSTDQENQIGAQVKTELETKQGVRYLADPEVTAYVRAVADNVIRFGKQERPDVQWQVFVIDDPKTVNAFATPGGYLYVYSGLLETAANEAELAGVMAHETGHVVARHAARNMVAAYGLDAVLALAGGTNGGLLSQLGSSVASQGLLLAHSRADETEADEYGARYASQATYDPHALISFFTKLKAQEGNSPKVLAYLSDHPATQDRIDHLNSFIAEKHLGGAVLNEAPFARIKQRLLSLPPTAPGAPPAAGPAPGAPPPAAPPPARPPGH